MRILRKQVWISGIGQNRPAAILSNRIRRKPRRPPWLSRMRKPLMLSRPRPFADGSETISGLFLWECPKDGFAKPEGMKNAVGHTADFIPSGAGVKGKVVPLAGLRGGSSHRGTGWKALFRGRGAESPPAGQGRQPLHTLMAPRH